MDQRKRPYYERLAIDEAFVGARAARLTNIIGEQGDEFFEAAGLTVPSRASSTILFINKNGPSSLVEIARALDEQHQLTAQRTQLLEKISIVVRKPDPNDRRRKTFHLTKHGAAEVALIERRCRQAIRIFDALNQELGFNLSAALDAAHNCLLKKSMMERLQEIEALDAGVTNNHHG